MEGKNLVINLLELYADEYGFLNSEKIKKDLAEIGIDEEIMFDIFDTLRDEEIITISETGTDTFYILNSLIFKKFKNVSGLSISLRMFKNTKWAKSITFKKE